MPTSTRKAVRKATKKIIDYVESGSEFEYENTPSQKSDLSEENSNLYSQSSEKHELKILTKKTLLPSKVSKKENKVVSNENQPKNQKTRANVKIAAKTASPNSLAYSKAKVSDKKTNSSFIGPVRRVGLSRKNDPGKPPSPVKLTK